MPPGLRCGPRPPPRRADRNARLASAWAPRPIGRPRAMVAERRRDQQDRARRVHRPHRPSHQGRRGSGPRCRPTPATPRARRERRHRRSMPCPPGTAWQSYDAVAQRDLRQPVQVQAGFLIHASVDRGGDLGQERGDAAGERDERRTIARGPDFFSRGLPPAARRTVGLEPERELEAFVEERQGPGTIVGAAATERHGWWIGR